MAEKEKTLAKIAPDHNASTDNAITDSIKAAEDVLRSEGQTVSIKSPIDGMVSAVWRHQGEKIVANANVPIVTISSLQPSRIIGYVRKPFSEMPKQGDIVNIRRQSFKREAAQGVVLEVSGQVEPISGTLVPSQPMQVGTAVLEMGLPFAVSIPSEMTLIPGEAVDLFFTKP